MMTYAIFTSGGVTLAYYTSEIPPTLEKLADHCAEVAGYADRDEWMAVTGVGEIAYAPVH